MTCFYSGAYHFMRQCVYFRVSHPQPQLHCYNLGIMAFSQVKILPPRSKQIRTWHWPDQNHHCWCREGSRLSGLKRKKTCLLCEAINVLYSLGKQSWVSVKIMQQSSWHDKYVIGQTICNTLENTKENNTLSMHFFTWLNAQWNKIWIDNSSFPHREEKFTGQRIEPEL